MGATITITGNISQKPVLETVQVDGEDRTICRLHVGYSINRGRKTGNFIEAATWGDAARNHAKYLTVGSTVRIDGELSHDTWLHNDEKRSRHSITNASVEYLGQPASSGDNKASEPVSDEAF